MKFVVVFILIFSVFLSINTARAEEETQPMSNSAQLARDAKDGFKIGCYGGAALGAFAASRRGLSVVKGAGVTIAMGAAGCAALGGAGALLSVEDTNNALEFERDELNGPQAQAAREAYERQNQLYGEE